MRGFAEGHGGKRKEMVECESSLLFTFYTHYFSLLMSINDKTDISSNYCIKGKLVNYTDNYN